MFHNSPKRNCLLLSLLVLLWCGALPASTTEWYRLLESSPQRLLLEVSPPSVPIDTLETETGALALFRSSSSPILAGGPWPAVPFQTLLIDWPVERISLRVISTSSQESIAIAPLAFRADVPVTGGPLPAGSLQSESRSGPPAAAEIEYAGAAGRQMLWHLRVYPFRYDAAACRVIRTGTIRLELIGEGGRLSPGTLPQLPGVSDIAITTAAPLLRQAGKGVTALTAPGRVQLFLEEDGWYHVSGGDLRKAGVDLLDIDVARLRLSCGGQEVPFYFNGDNDGQMEPGESIEFYGTGLRLDAPASAPDLYRDPYSSTNVYWLGWEGEAGLAMGEEYNETAAASGLSARIPYAYYHTVHVEQDGHFDHFYDISFADSLRDHWLYDSGIPAGSKRDYPFVLDYPDARSLLPVRVRVMMAGLSPGNKELHETSCFLNDRFAARGTGERQGIIDLHSRDDNGLLAASLNAGTNTLTVVNEFEPTRTDYIALNWFEVTYPRLYRADGGWLEFTIPPDGGSGFFLFTLDGFDETAVEIYKLGVSKITGATTAEVTGNDGRRTVRVQFYDTVPSHEIRYIAVTAAAKKRPVRISVVKPEWLPASRSDIDYLVIGPRSFLTESALTMLLQHRQSQGHQTAAVAVEDIFGYFNYGRRSPQAIKEFLKWAVVNWPLTYCLFAGDGSFLRSPVQGDTLDLVPVYMRQTLRYGAASSDFWYTLLEGDDEVPDIYLGRLPARTPEQLEVVVDKIIAHESNAESGEWHNRLLFIGGSDVTLTFRNKGLALARKSPPAWSPALLFTTRDPGVPVDPFFGNTPELLDFIDQGCGVINFHGHGGGAIWSDDGLLGLDDVESLNNKGRYPIVLSMTCFTGAFEQPVGENLAESMLFARDKGTMAFFGASGYGWLENDDFLQSAIMDYLYEHPQATLGEVVTAGKIRYYCQFFGSDIARSEANQYALFGDPATRLRLPSSQAAAAIANPLLAAGENLQAAVQWPFASGKATVEIEKELGRAEKIREVAIDQNRSSFDLPLPSSFSEGQGTLRLYGVDAFGLQQAHGAADFTLGRGFFDSLRIFPGKADSLHLFVQLHSRSEPASVLCLFRGDSLAMQPAGSGWYGLVVKSWWVQLSCQFLARYADGGTLISPGYTYDPGGRINVEALTDRMRWGGAEGPLLYLPLMNWGNGAGTITITMEYWRESDKNWHSLSADTLAVNAYAGATAVFPLQISPGEWTVRFVIDSGQEGQLETRAVAVPVVYALEPAAGFRFLEGTGDTLHLDERAACIAASHAVRERCALRAERRSPAQLCEQPDFSAGAIPVYALEYSRPEAVEQGVLFGCKIGPADVLPGPVQNAAIFYYENATRKWVRLPSIREDSLLFAVIRRSGLYTILWTADSQPPELDAAFDGRPYAAGAFTDRSAVISLHLRDQNGIDIGDGKLSLLLDGRALDDASWSLPDSIADGNLIPLMVRTDLLPGRHTLTVTAGDCNGNIAPPQELTFQVAEAFHLNLLGTYPNPFTIRTTFAYLLSSSAEKLSLKIYTAAGKLIRHFDGSNAEDPNPLSADYHEITWDGKDEEGFEVANGVYFYRLTARAGDKTEEKTGKIARLQ
jgi:hypothetical protein